jgi:hypothetical protein
MIGRVKQSLPKVRIHDLAGKGRHRCRDLADDVLGDTEFAQCLHQVDRDRIEMPLVDGESAMGIAHGRAAIVLRGAQCLRQAATQTPNASRLRITEEIFGGSASRFARRINGVRRPSTTRKLSSGRN